MNRKQWQAQRTGSQVNHYWLTWGNDQRIKRDLERKQLLRDVVLFALMIGAIFLIGYLTGEV